jgi:hypothetical protein
VLTIILFARAAFRDAVIISELTASAFWIWLGGLISYAKPVAAAKNDAADDDRSLRRIKDDERE